MMKFMPIPSLQSLENLIRRVLEPIRHNLEIITGQKGDKINKYVSFQDLVDLGVITEKEAQEQANK